MTTQRSTRRPLRSRAYLIIAIMAALAPSMSAAVEPLRIALNANWPPLSFATDDGEVRGVLVDVGGAIIGDLAGVPVVFEDFPWARAQKEVEFGRVDALITFPSEARRAYALTTEAPIFTVRNKAAARIGSESARSLAATPDDLSLQFRYCMDIANGAMTEFYASRAVVPAIAGDVPGCLRLIAAGRTDVLIHAEPTIRSGLKQLNGGGGGITILDHVYRRIPLTLLVRQSRPDAAEIIAKVDAALRDSDPSRLERIYTAAFANVP